MSSIGESIEQLNKAKELLDEAWDLASQAKEKAQEARETIAAVAGPDAPEMLEQSLQMTDEGYGQVEQGQALFTTTQERLGEYIAQIS